MNYVDRDSIPGGLSVPRVCLFIFVLFLFFVFFLFFFLFFVWMNCHFHSYSHFDNSPFH